MLDIDSSNHSNCTTVSTDGHLSKIAEENAGSPTEKVEKRAPRRGASFRASFRQLSMRVLPTRTASSDTLDSLDKARRRRKVRFSRKVDTYKFPRVHEEEYGNCWWTQLELLKLRNESKEERQEDADFRNYMMDYLESYQQVCQISKVVPSSVSKLERGAALGLRGMEVFCRDVTILRQKRVKQIIQSVIYSYKEKVSKSAEYDAGELRELSLSLTFSSELWAVALAEADRRAIEQGLSLTTI